MQKTLPVISGICRVLNALTYLARICVIYVKMGDFFWVEIAKCFVGKGLKSFIFLAESKIVSAQSMRKWVKNLDRITGFRFGCFLGV